jgi:hypothetical protein
MEILSRTSGHGVIRGYPARMGIRRAVELGQPVFHLAAFRDCRHSEPGRTIGRSALARLSSLGFWQAR